MLGNIPLVTLPSRSVAGPDYRLGNGDVLEVQIAGRLEVTRLQVIVDPEGMVSVPPVGNIEVGGLTLLEANRRVGERARAMLRFADVSIAVSSPRVFEVVLSGEVERPGASQAQATQRLHELIISAGGVTSRGSARHVQITRGTAVREVDLLRFELRGDIVHGPNGILDRSADLSQAKAGDFDGREVRTRKRIALAVQRAGQGCGDVAFFFVRQERRQRAIKRIDE